MNPDMAALWSRGWRRPWFALAVALTALAPAAGEAAEIRVYEDVGYRGRSQVFDRDVRDLRAAGLNDRVSSLRIDSGTWELCREIDFRDCRVFRSDEDDLLRLGGWNDAISSLRQVGSGSGITVYEDLDYRGASRSLERETRDLRGLGWNDKVSSFRIDSGTWELCREIDFRDCRTFRSDERDLTRLRGWNDAISSLRRVGGDEDRPEIEVFEHFDYEGGARRFDRAIDALQSQGWNDRISSLRVRSGRWEICRHNGYRECREIGGAERRLSDGWNDAISSLRPLRPFRDD